MSASVQLHSRLTNHKVKVQADSTTSFLPAKVIPPANVAEESMCIPTSQSPTCRKTARSRRPMNQSSALYVLQFYCDMCAHKTM